MLTRTLALLSCLPPVLAQRTPERLLILEHPALAAGRVHAALVWPWGASHDPQGRAGLAQLFRWYLYFDLQRRPKTEGFRRQVTIRVLPDALVVQAGVEAEQAAALGTWLRAVLDPQLAVDGDTFALARGRACLHADDAAMVYPGTRLRRAARVRCLAGSAAGRPLLGEAAELAKLQAVDFAAARPQWLSCRGAVLAWAGAMPGELAAALGALPAGVAGPSLPTPAASGAAAPAAEMSCPRSSGGYALLALPTPRPVDPGFPAFCLLMDLCRREMNRSFGRPSSQMLAGRGQYLSYQPQDGARLACLMLRGPEGAAAPAVAQRLQRFWEGFLSRPVAARRLVQARRRLAPAFAAARPRSAAQLVMSAMQQACAWPADLAARIAAVQPGELQALQQRLRQGGGLAALQMKALAAPLRLGR